MAAGGKPRCAGLGDETPGHHPRTQCGCCIGGEPCLSTARPAHAAACSASSPSGGACLTPLTRRAHGCVVGVCEDSEQVGALCWAPHGQCWGHCWVHMIMHMIMSLAGAQPGRAASARWLCTLAPATTSRCRSHTSAPHWGLATGWLRRATCSRRACCCLRAWTWFPSSQSAAGQAQGSRGECMRPLFDAASTHGITCRTARTGLPHAARPCLLPACGRALRPPASGEWA